MAMENLALAQGPTQQEAGGHGHANGCHGFLSHIDPAVPGELGGRFFQRVTRGFQTIGGTAGSLGQAIYRCLHTRAQLVNGGACRVGRLVKSLEGVGFCVVHGAGKRIGHGVEFRHDVFPFKVRGTNCGQCLRAISSCHSAFLRH